jgi:hypothetical protein
MRLGVLAVHWRIAPVGDDGRRGGRVALALVMVVIHASVCSVNEVPNGRKSRS